MSKPQPNPLTERPRWRISAGVVVIVILILVMAAGVGVQWWRSNSGVNVENANGPEPTMITPPGTSGTGVTVGQANAKASIDLYLDFRCPHCKDFEDASGPTINALVDSGAAKVTYWPMDFVNPDASPRLANAWACAAAAGKARSYSDELYKSFEKTWTTDQLLELGKELGIGNQTFDTCVRNNSQAGWVDSIQSAAEQRGVSATPTVFVNGHKLGDDQLTPDGIRAAVGAS